MKQLKSILTNRLLNYWFINLVIGIMQFPMIINSSTTSKATTTKPHIIIIMSDDMGFNDVSFHGSNEIPTPNIDALATYGIALNRYYVAPMCTPSRASLMTGKYSTKLGMQHFVIPSEQPWGLGLNETILPQYMKQGGYNTHIIGKWHLGFYKKEYTPLKRGFDSHFGYLGPYIDYFNHSLTRKGLPWPFESGYDMRRNMSTTYESQGTYATDLFSDVAVETIKQHNRKIPMFMYLSHLAPHAANFYDQLQAPIDEIKKFNYIKDRRRRIYAAMVSRLDRSVGMVVEALRDNEMLDNSIILFFCDNGAPTIGEHENLGSNYPFKGQKDTPWDGAVRSAGAIWSPLLKKRQRVSNQLFHITDWLPTFANLAGVTIKESDNLDGHNIWESLSLDKPSPRHDILFNIDDDIGYSSYLNNHWKYINGSTYRGKYDHWLDIGRQLEFTTESGNNAINENSDEPGSSASFYSEKIKQSKVGEALASYSYSLTMGRKFLLTNNEIDQLRLNSTVTCNNILMPEINSIKQCDPMISPCLFNIINDPCERENLATEQLQILKLMEEKVQEFRNLAIKPRNQPSDSRSNPKYFKGIWTWWFDELGLPDHDVHNTRILEIRNDDNTAKSKASYLYFGILQLFCSFGIVILLKKN